jgi:hypothetical protein
MKSSTVGTPKLNPNTSTAPADAACEDHSEHRGSFGARNRRLGAIRPSYDAKIHPSAFTKCCPSSKQWAVEIARNYALMTNHPVSLHPFCWFIDLCLISIPNPAVAKSVLGLYHSIALFAASNLGPSCLLSRDSSRSTNSSASVS